MRSGRKRLISLGVVFVLVAAACGDDEDTAPVSAPTSAAPTTAAAGTPTTTAATTTAAPVAAGNITGDLTFSLDESFTATEVGRGTKPVLSLAPDGTPGVAYVLEDLEGFIAYADAADGWTPQTVTDGYFYGPIGLAYSLEGTPVVGYHDHQATTFEQNLGDLTIAVKDASGWSIEAIEDDGHDGWDSTLAIGRDGVFRAAGIDPQQFGREDGVEYFELGASGWEVTPIGSGPIAYEFNVSLAVDLAGNPALTYFDNNTEELIYASRVDGVWRLETVDADGDTGRYSSLAFDADGTPHVTYYKTESQSSGTVRYAVKTAGTWETEDVDLLSDVRPGFTGARRITAVAIDSTGAPHVLYSDESVVKYATLADGQWNISTVLTAGSRALGQLVSFELDGADTPHIAIFEVTSSQPLDGIVAYITAAA